MVPYMLSQFCCLMRLACDQIQSGLLKVLKFVFGHMPKNRNEAGFLAPFWFVTVVKKEKMKADQKINMEVFWMKSSVHPGIQIPCMRNVTGLEIGEKLACLEPEAEDAEVEPKPKKAKTEVEPKPKAKKQVKK